MSEGSIPGRRKDPYVRGGGNAGEGARALERRYALLAENIKEALVIDGRDGRVACVNDRFLEMFGFTRDDLATLRLEDCVTPQWRVRLRETRDLHASREDAPRRLECEGLRKNGTVLWVEVSVMPIVEDGCLMGRQSLIQDVSAQRDIHARFAECERELTLARQLARLAGWTYDTATQFITWSGETYHMSTLDPRSGFAPPGEQTQLICPDDRSVVQAAARAALQKGRAHMFELCILGPDGRERWIAMLGDVVRRPDGAIAGMSGVAQDITERRRAEQALQDCERFIRGTLDSLSAQVVVVNEAGLIETANRAWRDLAVSNGFVVGSVCQGADYLEICDRAGGALPEGAAGFGAAVRELLADRRDGFEAECLCQSLDRPRWFASRAARFFAGDSTYAVVIHEDVSARRRTEKALRLSEERFCALAANTPGVVVRCEARPPWRMHFCSDGPVVTGGHPACVGSRTYAGMVHPEDLPLVERAIAESVADGRALAVEHRSVRADGSVRWVDLRGRALTNSSGTQTWLDLVILDITRRKEAEKAAEVIATRLACLSEQERRVLDLLVAGAAQKQVAVRLGMALRTVQLHRTRIMEKMQVDSLAELVQMTAALHAARCSM